MSSIRWPEFVLPELFLLAIPLGFLYWKFGQSRGLTGGLRLALLVVLCLALTVPLLNLGGQGLDLVVVVDRSLSMPAQSEKLGRELLTNLLKSRGTGDRIGIVTYGSSAAVESELLKSQSLSPYTKEILPDGSDLNAALHAALDLLRDPNRPGRILVFSDGEANGPNPRAAARRALEMGIPVDYREFPSLRTGDVAITGLELPERVGPREPFQFSVVVHVDHDVTGKLVIKRDGKEMAKITRNFVTGSHGGTNRVLFHDVLETGGTYNYTAELDVDDDPLPENNRGAGVVQVEAAARMLVLNADGQDDNFIRALRAGKLLVDVAAADTHPLTLDSLDRYRAVVLENVTASTLGRIKMERLAQFVEDLGGGLMLTGGERSFGTGGYFKSPLDPVLPVSMEMRKEHRNTRVAIAVALDRSGSMMAPAKGGRQKMDLANIGTVECIKTLSPGDSVAVIAVDSLPHVIQPLTDVEQAASIIPKVLKIRSEGGGIFVYEALVAAGRELNKADQATKHIILFSDAADSEEPGAYKTLLAKFQTAGMTVSVIGLGSKADTDAALLEDIAKLGKGNISFTNDPEELPRLFAQDTMSVARSTFVKKDPKTQAAGIGGQIVPTSRLMGDYVTGAFPPIDGYNLSYLKERATQGVVTQDEYKAPLSAFWFIRLGRAAALTMEMDGPHTGSFGSWNEYADFVLTHARWLMNGGDDPGEAFLRLSREGQEAVVTLELDPDRPTRAKIEAPTLTLIAPSEERETRQDLPLQWSGPHLLQARFKLTKAGTYRALVREGDRFIARAPAITLPYSPEFMPRPKDQPGSLVLKEIAELSHGKPRIDVLEVLADAPRSARRTSLLPWLFALAIVLLVLEIAVRRLGLWTRLVDALIPETAAESAQIAAAKAGAVRHRRPGLVSRPTVQVAARGAGASATVPAPDTATTSTKESAPAEAPPALDVFAAAKQRARKRRSDS